VEKNEFFVSLKAHQPKIMPIMPANASTSNDGPRGQESSKDDRNAYEIAEIY